MKLYCFTKQESQSLLQILHHYENFSGCFYLDNPETAAFDLSPLMTGSAQAYYEDQSEQVWDFSEVAQAGKFKSKKEEINAIELACEYVRDVIEGSFDIDQKLPEPWIDSDDSEIILNLSQARDLILPLEIKLHY